MRIVPLYAALLALLFVALGVRTLRMRRRLRVAVGDGGHPALLRAMRVHANFAEYTPLALLLFVFVETSGAPGWLVHALGLAFLLGRVAHAVGVSRVDERFAYRVFAMTMTFAPMTLAALWLLRMAWLTAT